MANQQKNIAYYLKYRPQSLNDLIGQDSVKKILTSSFSENRLSHAYLFVGPRGTGKTSTARILAKMVNCEESTDYSLQSTEVGSRKSEDNIPCNKCSTCLSITDGSNLDLIEIDAASNRGIDDIRSLREKIKLSPSSCKKKVYIIDEVHMLTTEAFNALLKTLEEPPAHALFILATTDVQKLPQTILSRVQRLDFKLATADQLTASLKRIVEKEKIDIDEEALKLLVRKSDGSFRDGVKLLDQVSSVGGKITGRLVQDSLKSSQFEDVLQILQSLSDKNAKECLLFVINQVNLGVDIKELILSLMDNLRSLVFIKNELGESLVKPNFTEEKYQALLKLAENFTMPDLIKSLDLLQTAYEKLKFASIPSLPLELAVVETCSDESSVMSHQSSVQEQSQEINPLSTIDPPSSSSDSSDLFKLKEKWTYICETIRPYNFSLEALLRAINIKEVKESTVYVEVPYSFHQRILEAPKNRDLFESVLSDVLGRTVRISTVLGVRPQRKEDIANIEVAADDEIIRAAAEIFSSDSVN